LVELLVVMGLISVLVTLLLPAMGKARAAARAAACLSNVRQLGTAWQMYTAENKGHLPYYQWRSVKTPDVAWNGYWPGVVERYGARDASLLCPSASEVSQQGNGYGSAHLAWNGEKSLNGTVVKLNPATYRVGSYGYNNYLAIGPDDAVARRITGIRGLSDVPVFMDCAWVDARPENQSESTPVEAPPDLNGNVDAGSPDHWRFLLARHGRGINVSFADGSARWVPLEETYSMKWNGYWQNYRLALASR
jgi:prepilin-type processing-associated H-X9-DG protein